MKRVLRSITVNTRRFGALSVTAMMGAAIGLILMTATVSVGAAEAFSRVVSASPLDGYEDEVVLQHADSDASGSTYVASAVRGPAQFAPGIGVPAKTSGNYNLEPYDVVLSQLDASGGWRWAKRVLISVPFSDSIYNGPVLTTPSRLTIQDIKVGPTNIFLVGNIRGSGTGARDAGFVIKLDKGGNVLWTRYLVGESAAGQAFVNAVVEAPDGSVSFGGRVLQQTALLWAGAGRLERRSAVASRDGFGSDAYIIKLDANGNWVSSVTTSGGGDEETVALEVDGIGDLHALINTKGDGANVRNANGTTAYTNIKFPAKTAFGLFVAKLNSSGFWSNGRYFGQAGDMNAAAAGGELQSLQGTDLKLIAGKVFVAGTFSGQNVGQDQGFVARLTAENLGSDGAVAYFRAGVNGRSFPTRIRSSGRGMFVVGELPRTLRVFGNVSPTSTDMGEADAELVGLREGDYVCGLDLHLKPLWLRSTARPEVLPTPRSMTGGVLAYDYVSRRVYWGGGFRTEGSESLVVGEAPFETSLRAVTGTAVGERLANWGWLTAFDEEGRSIQQVRLSLTSRIPGYRVNGVTINTANYSEAFLEGATLQLQASDTLATGGGTRHIFLGYAGSDGSQTSGIGDLNLNLVSDTALTLQWRTEHRLKIESDHAGAGLVGTALAGNPIPVYGTNWIAEGTFVDATVDGLIESLEPTESGTRLVLRSFTVTDTVARSQVVAQVVDRVLVGQLKAVGMSGPVTLSYSWKKQHKVGVQVGNPDAAPLLITRQTPVTATSPTYTGPGEFWFDDKAGVELLARGTDAESTLTLKGWDYAAPVSDYFPQTTFLPDDPNRDLPTQLTENSRLTRTTLVANGPVFYARRIASLGRSASILWNYGDPVLAMNVAVGVGFGFPAVANKGAAPTRGWAGIRILNAPSGSTPDDMMIWDPRNKLAIPTRPGVFLVDLDYGTAPATKRVTLQVYTGFSGDPFQNDPTGAQKFNNPAGFQLHIAGTPPVPVDPKPRDRFWFKELRYTTGGATIKDGRFEANLPGRSVLVFTALRSDAPPTEYALGDFDNENVQVRVVETLEWDKPGALTVESSPATIGTPLASPTFDLAKLGTGYVVHEIANYNADVYDRETVSGPIIPVNGTPWTQPADIPLDRQLVVAWYEEKLGVVWPYKTVMYPFFAWPTGGERIVVASRLGSEGLNAAQQRQLRFDPELYEDVRIYNQPDPQKPGFNPNEEHARIYPSMHALLTGKNVSAAFALRNDLNIDLNLINASGGRLTRADYTSDPYVLVQYVEKATQQARMAVYSVIREDTGTRDPWAAELPGAAGDTYRFVYNVVAGERLTAPYPLNLALGLEPCINSVPNLFQTASNLPDGTYFQEVTGQPRAWFVDHKGGTWAAGGDAGIRSYFFYPLADDFWYPFEKDSAENKRVLGSGSCVPWLPVFNLSTGQLGVFDPDASDFRIRNEPVQVTFTSQWPVNAPVLKVGETLTYAGGEFKADHPDAVGLPGVLGFAAAEVVFDSKNPGKETQVSAPVNYVNSYSARIIAPLEDRRLAVPITSLPENLNSPAKPDITVDGDTWYFNRLSPSLQRRVVYKPLAKLTANSAPGVLVLRGFVNDKALGASDLTAAPPPVYVLEPNVLNSQDVAELTAIASDASVWGSIIGQLATLSRNPAGVGSGPGDGWNVGLERIANDASNVKPLSALGPGLALVPNPSLLDPSNGFGPGKSGYVTIAENNHPSLEDAPVTLHVIRIDPTERYRGAIKTLLPANVFDEKVTLRHTADFGGNVDRVMFSWWYRGDDGKAKTGDVPPGVPGVTPIWESVGSADGVQGRVELGLAGNTTLLLADNHFFARYRFNRTPVAESDWSGWAGAANSAISDLDGDGRPDFRAQLAMGWVKRVLDAVNPYEARIREFSKSDSPSTVSSMIRQLGVPYVGPVALNASKDVVENLGLIELYETVLKRARDMTVDGSAGNVSAGIHAALLLASTRLAEFYTLLGNEAWDDALDPTIGYGGGEVENGSLDTSRFSFENQMPDLLNEELALLRGVDESFGRPVFNRLFWNFTKGEGEVAYALNYQIADVNRDGFIDESDALKQHPMGHGDAWGHYLSAMRKRYDLLRASLFDWDSRSEYYNLLDVTVGVDFNDERLFARTAAARARVGAAIVNLTFRSRYSEVSDSKLTGYTDPDQERAWGVTEWARRAGQAAYFDWVTANALLPQVDLDPSHEGIERIDRQTVTEIAEISTEMAGIQVALDGANSGMNALGLDPDVMSFDIDPTHLDVGSTAQVGTKPVQGLTHYEQVYERAIEAMRNADMAFDFANDQKARARGIEQSADRLRAQAIAQDLEYRNRLIEIFGTPYEGQIGPGKAYPAGYAGPDLNLFMYVDVNAITPDTVPLANADTYFDEYVSFHELTQDIPEEFRADLEEHFLDDISLEGNTAVELLGDDLVHLRLPATASDYTFVAPEDWGQRSAPGRVQQLVTEMLQVQADLNIAVGDYDYLIKQLRDRVSLLKLRADVNVETLAIREEGYNRTLGLEAAINVLKGAAIAGGRTADWLELIGEATAELPLAAGTTIDPTAPARQAVKFAASAGWLASSITAGASEAAANVLESSKELFDLRDGIDIDKKEMSVELRGMLHEIEEMLVNEGVTRIRLFSIREQLRGLLDQYRATLQEGIRIVEARRNANIQLAGATQSNRYHDMLFRSGRHESIQRYRSLYDLAQRYCYLAAKAYDYETNFESRDRASAQPLLAQIVRARSLGNLGPGAPLAGPGLAGVMARLQDNFRAVEGRLGFNNLQRDTTTFSLRREWARIPSDNQEGWRQFLAAATMPDLWSSSEFRRYCRPSTADPAPQPGLIFTFSSQVLAAQNFFGRPLGAGDSTYDPTVYATKIRAAGVRFRGYPIEQLARTPYVYLVPVGMDTMTIPNSRSLKTRKWNVMDQAIPVPHVTGPLDLTRALWIPGLDTLAGALGEIRRFSSFRAGVVDGDPELNVTRFVGRSVWNDRWVLIIPGLTLHVSPELGLEKFIDSISDIELTLETYGYSGN